VVLGRRWEAAHEDLKRHAAECGICRDVVAVARLLSADHEQARHDVRVPAAGQVWWRAAVRARLEAARTAARPLTWLEGVAGACAIGLGVAVVGFTWPSLLKLAGWLRSHAPAAGFGVFDVTAVTAAAVQSSLAVAFIIAACIVLAPVAIYFALSDE
jgi:hypothetical protein